MNRGFISAVCGFVYSHSSLWTSDFVCAGVVFWRSAVLFLLLAAFASVPGFRALSGVSELCVVCALYGALIWWLCSCALFDSNSCAQCWISFLFRWHPSQFPLRLASMQSSQTFPAINGKQSVISWRRSLSSIRKIWRIIQLMNYMLRSRSHYMLQRNWRVLGSWKFLQHQQVQNLTLLWTSTRLIYVYE